MIPRLAPNWDWSDIKAFFTRDYSSIKKFETKFARLFEQKYALSFAYGRIGLYFFLKVVGLKNVEIIMPAYSCVVVAHAISLSGNIPIFIDSRLPDFNMDLNLVKQAINQKTRCIIATHIFGYPLDINKLKIIVKAAEKKYGHKIWIVQDCAHSFGAKWQGKLVTSGADLALFGLNISKTITSVQGGMVTTDNKKIFDNMLKLREEGCRKLTVWENIKKVVYFFLSLFAFHPIIYSLVNLLEQKTSFLKRLTEYYRDNSIDLPDDAWTLLSSWQARIGHNQILKYNRIITARVRKAEFYFKHLKSRAVFTLPPCIQGATYSHYTCLVKNQTKWLKIGQKNGVQFGKLIDYVIPLMPAYRKAKFWQTGIAKQILPHTINLPINKHANVSYITNVINSHLV